MKSTARRRTSDAEIDRAVQRGRKHDRMSTKIFSATYDRRRDMVAITLSTGATIAVPRSTLSRLAEIAPKDLVSVQIEPPGYSIWFEHPDIGLHLDTILQAVTGNASRSIAASAMGSATSSGKVAAVRANGRKGGRPMTMTSFVAALDHQLHLLRPEAPNVHVSDNPNPNLPASATWNCGPHRLYVKFHGMKDVQVQRSWNSTEPPIQPRSAVTARRLASDLARNADVRDTIKS